MCAASSCVKDRRRGCSTWELRTPGIRSQGRELSGLRTGDFVFVYATKEHQGSHSHLLHLRRYRTCEVPDGRGGLS
jgi:hypothetical protein